MRSTRERDQVNPFFPFTFHCVLCVCVIVCVVQVCVCVCVSVCVSVRLTRAYNSKPDMPGHSLLSLGVEKKSMNEVELTINCFIVVTWCAWQWITIQINDVLHMPRLF